MLNEILNKCLRSRFKEIGKLIKEKDYSLVYINPYKTTFNIDSDHKTETFIYQLLKNALVIIYLDIQEAFLSLCSDIMEEQDIYTQMIFEHIPEKTFLKDAPAIIKLNAKDAIPRNTKALEFKPIMDDIRPINNKITSYHHIVKRPQTFASFEEKLFMNEYLNLDYTFTDKHGYKNELAKIYHIVIDKGYFKKFNDVTKKPISDKEICRFLDYRYNINLDKQFRTIATQVSEINDFKEANNWLTKLPTC